MILLDYSSIVMSSLMIRIEQYEEDLDLIRHTIFNMIRNYNVEHRAKYGEMILCMDNKNNWRKTVFPHYKANRKKSRDDSKHDWKKIFDTIDGVKQDLIENSPFRCVTLDGVEADDIIGVAVEKHMSPEPILIISPDKDFIQLQKYPNVDQYSNTQKKWLKPEVSAEYDLWTKILKGDKGDGVPNVMSDDDTFINEGARQNVLTKKNMELLMKDPEALGTTVARRIIRNRTMVDLTRVPEEYKEQIMTEFNKPAKGSISKMINIFTKYKMKLLMESLSDFECRK